VTKKSVVKHQAHFVPLRVLWLSLIGKEQRETEFPQAHLESPRRLVTTSVFVGRFWETLSDNEKIVKIGSYRAPIHAERAWFGIRSILKGGHLGHVKKIFEKTDFGQLTDSVRSGNVPKGATKDYFNDAELELIIEIHKKYEKWKNKNQLYDDLDIVNVSLKSHLGESAKNNFRELSVKIDKNDLDLAIQNYLNFGNEMFQFKQTALDKIEELKSGNKVQKKAIVQWLTKWEDKINNDLAKRSRRVGTARFEDSKQEKMRDLGIYKDDLGDNAGRIFFSGMKDKARNKGKLCLIIYDFTFNHDEQDGILKTLLEDHIDDGMIEGEEQNLRAPSGIHIIDKSPGIGPVKPLPGRISEESLDRINDKGNISLDYHQKSAILNRQPLLIDGLAGTGKTAVLAKRGSLRVAKAESSTNILVTASKGHVVKRLQQDIETTVDNTDWGENNPDVSYLGTGFKTDDDAKIKMKNIESFREDLLSIKFGYDEILVDECQDLTRIEFRLLTKLANGHNCHRLSMAGDPLQTLNPTGFDWGRISAMFMDKSQTHPVSKEDAERTKFHSNYRSELYIVLLANAIQRHRARLFSNQDQIEMDPKKGAKVRGKTQVIKIRKGSSDDFEATKKAIDNAGKSDIAAICWASDDAAILNLLEGPKCDDILSGIWEQKKKDDEVQELDDEMTKANFRTKLLVHSSSSIKGDEYNNILLYKFASNGDARSRLASLLVSRDELKTIGIDEKIPISYAYSMLYVAITRAFQNVYLVEDEEGFDFWKNVKLENANGKLVDLIDTNETNYAKEAFATPQFNPTIETTQSNYQKNVNKWENEGSIPALSSAIHIAKELLKSEGLTNQRRNNLERELNKLYGDLYLHGANISPNTNMRDEKLTRAIDHYQAAQEFERIAPLEYEKEDWENCLEAISNFSTKSPFIEMVGYYCKFKLKLLSIEDEEEANQMISKLKSPPPPVNPEHWGSIDISSIKTTIRQFLLKELVNNKLYDVLKKEVNWLDRTKVIRELNDEDVEIKLEIIESDMSKIMNHQLEYIRCIKIIANTKTDFYERIRILDSKYNQSSLPKELKNEISNLLIQQKIDLIKSKNAIHKEKIVKIIFDGDENWHSRKAYGWTKPLASSKSRPGYDQLLGIHSLKEIKELDESGTMIEQHFGKRVSWLMEAIENIKQNNFENCLDSLINIRIRSIVLDPISCDYLDWIRDNEIIDRFAMKLQEKRMDNCSGEELEKYLAYSKLVNVDGNSMYERSIQSAKRIFIRGEDSRIEILFSSFHEIIVPKGRKAKSSEIDLMKCFIVNLGDDKLTLEQAKGIKSSSLKLPNNIYDIVKLIYFKQDNKILMSSIARSRINPKDKDSALKLIELLGKTERENDALLAEKVQRIIPTDVNELMKDLSEAKSINSFYDIANKAYNLDKEMLTEVLSIPLYIDTFSRLIADMSDLQSNEGHMIWDLLCSKMDGSTFDLLGELCENVANSMNIVTTCRQRWSLITMIKKFDKLKGLTDNFILSQHYTTIIEEWADIRLDEINSTVARTTYKRTKQASGDLQTTRTKLRNIRFYATDTLYDSMATCLVIELAKSDVKQLNSMINVLNLPKGGAKKEKIDRILQFCGVVLQDFQRDIFELK